MVTIRENQRLWDGDYDWSQAGEEWSNGWGGSRNQWLTTVWPRISRFLPATRILEIAPGHGRWTHYLRDYCERLEGVDLSTSCIDACQRRFAGDDRLTFHVNDGTSLAMIQEGTIDFVFSLDSLVHVEADVLARYLKQIRDKLTSDGVGFIHHSNADRYRDYFDRVERLPGRVHYSLLYGRGRRFRLADNLQLRALSVSAETFRELCNDAGLVCVSQEQITWHTRRMIDCHSIFTLPGSRWDMPPRTLENSRFMDELKVAQTRGQIY